MLHDRGKEWNIVADASMVKASSASAWASIARAALGMGDELGNHRIVVQRNLAASVTPVSLRTVMPS